jgi:hypothetical protein
MRLVLLLVLASSCASTRPAPAPLVLARPALAYEASLRGLEAVDRPAPAAEPAGLEVDLRLRILRLAGGAAAALEGERLGPNAWVTRRSELTRLEIEEAAPLQAPILLLKAGLSTNWAVLNQRAYVASYEVVGNSEVLLVDPVIATCSTGLQCLLTTTAEGEAVGLEIDLRQCDELGPPAERSVQVPGLAAGATVQLPELLTQRLRTEARLAPDECLVLSWNDGRDADARVFALVTAALVPAQGTR